jgi:hypothetical protein
VRGRTGRRSSPLDLSLPAHTVRRGRRPA